MSEKQTNTSLTDRIWDFFCSLKLTIIILLLLALTSVIGTLIQQNAPAEEYIREYGQANYELFVKLQFIDMYHSWWFIGLLGLFSINLICCSIKHFPRVWKFVADPQLVASPGTLKNSANRAEYAVKEDAAQVSRRLSELLKKEYGKVTETEKDGKSYLFAQKGIYSRFGAYVTHLSILIIMAGAIIGNLWGYKAYVNIVEGTSTDKVWSRSGQQPVELGFTVRCDDFDVSYYPNSRRPKDYTSDLVVLENGKEVLKKTIEVNDPLTYKGITFYQSSYGPAGNAFFKVKVTENATGKVLNLDARQGEHVKLPNGYAFAISNFTENDRQFGPAMQLSVNAPDGKPGRPFVVWKNYPQFDVKRAGIFSFELIDFQEPQYTGLQVAKDPGVEIVWLGCFLMMFGSMSAFFFSHKRVWVCLETEAGKTKIQLAANAHRNQAGFSLAFDEFKQKLDATIENKSPEKEG
ncbi:cytochrome c biogenesis protein [Malonomonas rubra DSM 5091]|uniref:Cytochrome c biogenesis protein n=1 Tax=Malonomonas rubra DSM 5091 TaxID=1122189 RepID=A0A1M6NSD8_MALRU|nr:cytochrome c biogenesis protein ResB [Malonomonas rubra]SHJ98576.1 cytochrome c biogenesis protein [Malonomonas rubra DSM 5091]